MKSGINFTCECGRRGQVKRDDMSSFLSFVMRWHKDVQTKIPVRQLYSQKSDRFRLDILIRVVKIQVLTEVMSVNEIIY